MIRGYPHLSLGKVFLWDKLAFFSKSRSNMGLFQLGNFAFGSKTVTLIKHLHSKISLQVLFSSFFCFVVHLFRFCVSVLMTYNLRHHTESTSLVFPPIGLSSSWNPVFICHNGCIRYFHAGHYVYRNNKKPR